MPAIVRYDEQHCPIARALDMIGDRWTLLILRELIISDQRYTDLAAHLPGIAPTLLSQRLRTMVEQGLITTKELPPPAARSVYSATIRGRQATTVLRALTRFGMPLLEAPDDDVVVRPWTAAHAAVGAYFQPHKAIGVDERYLLRIDGEEFTMSSVPGGGVAHDKPDLVLEGPARAFLDVRQGRSSLRQAITTGRLIKRGSARALANFACIFQLDHPVSRG
jgi:DNA-binding HxlR family transcriptional regulator